MSAGEARSHYRDCMDATELPGFVTGARCVGLPVRRSVRNFSVGASNNVFPAPPIVLARERSVAS